LVSVVDIAIVGFIFPDQTSDIISNAGPQRGCSWEGYSFGIKFRETESAEAVQIAWFVAVPSEIGVGPSSFALGGCFARNDTIYCAGVVQFVALGEAGRGNGDPKAEQGRSQCGFHDQHSDEGGEWWASTRYRPSSAVMLARKFAPTSMDEDVFVVHP
jgi:hypothetical protein